MPASRPQGSAAQLSGLLGRPLQGARRLSPSRNAPLPYPVPRNGWGLACPLARPPPAPRPAPRYDASGGAKSSPSPRLRLDLWRCSGSPWHLSNRNGRTAGVPGQGPDCPWTIGAARVGREKLSCRAGGSPGILPWTAGAARVARGTSAFRREAPPGYPSRVPTALDRRRCSGSRWHLSCRAGGSPGVPDQGPECAWTYGATRVASGTLAIGRGGGVPRGTRPGSRLRLDGRRCSGSP